MAKRGDFYIDNATGDYYLYSGTSWVFQGNLKGPTGPTGPAGPPGTSDGTLRVTKTAYEDILTGEVVRLHSSTQVRLADPSGTVDESLVYGVATQDATTGNDVEVMLLGELTDVVFSAFSLNTLLFLDASGGITDTRPTTGHLSIVGKAMGSNTIFVNPQLPTVL